MKIRQFIKKLLGHIRTPKIKIRFFQTVSGDTEIFSDL